MRAGMAIALLVTLTACADETPDRSYGYAPTGDRAGAGGDTPGGDTPTAGDPLSVGDPLSSGDGQGDPLAGGDAQVVTCTDHDGCAVGQYCHFPSNWIPGMSGSCDGPCANSTECDFSQECISGRCYSNLDCTPGACGCPPGEVCRSATHFCSAPPASCYFTEQCPCGWVCDSSNLCCDTSFSPPLCF